MTTTTRFPETRHASFSWKKAVKPVASFIVRVFDAFVEARRLKAAMETAQHLKTHNRDYRNVSLGDIVRQIMDDNATKSVKS